MLLRFCLFGAFLALPALGADDCRNMRASIELSQRQLSEFTQLQAELQEKYQKYITDDIVNQVDGVLDEISHASAVKVVFAQKRLKEAIEEKKTLLMSARNEFCTKCTPGEKAEKPERTAFCEKCPTTTTCGTASK
jgi:hypothetical protein